MMKNMQFSILLMVFLTTLLSCKKPDIPIVKNGNIDPVVWKAERKYKGLASNNFIYKDYLIQGIGGSSGGYQVFALSLDSGKQVWNLEGFPGGFDAFNVHESLLHDNIFFISGGDFLRGINLDEGKILWEATLDHGIGNIAVIDNSLFKSSADYLSSKLFKYNITTGSRVQVFEITKAKDGDNKYEPALSVPVKWIDDNGNTLLILSSRGYAPIGGSYRMDIMAWNVTADSMEWYRKGLEERGSITRPIIDDNRVYFYSIFKLHCIDANTGETIWDWETDPRDNYGGFKTANMLMVGNKMIVKPDSYWMYALDKMTGQRIWVNENTSPMPYLLREHQDTIWFSSGGVFGIDANTGWKLIDDWDKANTSGFWGNAIIHHPTNGYIYTTDGDYIYCLDPRYMN